MTPRWIESSRKHRVPHADQVWALVHSTFRALLPGESIDDGEVWLYIGHPHALTGREVEILITVYGDGREAVVFHAMELGPKFRRYREESHND